MIDITLNEPAQAATGASSRFNVSLYLADFDRDGGQLAVEMHDLASLGLAAPTQKLLSFCEGVYMTFEIDRSVRFRVMEITGTYPRNDADVSVSAVFFGGNGA